MPAESITPQQIVWSCVRGLHAGSPMGNTYFRKYILYDRQKPGNPAHHHHPRPILLYALNNAMPLQHCIWSVQS